MNTWKVLINPHTDSQVADVFIGPNGKCKGYILNMDIFKLDDAIIQQKAETFSGFGLAILDFPEVNKY